MRPSDEQVRRSLAALRAATADRDLPAAPAQVDGVPAQVVESLLAQPHVRPEAVERARARLAGAEPTPEELADKLVGRLVCDRLR